MKDKVLIFIIGFLVGAVVTTGISYIYITTSKSNNNNNNTQMNGEQPPKLPSGENGEPPEKPEGEMGQPPEKPDNNN